MARRVLEGRAAGLLADRLGSLAAGGDLGDAGSHGVGFVGRSAIGRLDPDDVAQRVADVFMSIRTEVKKIMAPLGRPQSLPIGMSDALGVDDEAIAERLQINYIC